MKVGDKAVVDCLAEFRPSGSVLYECKPGGFWEPAFDAACTQGTNLPHPSVPSVAPDRDYEETAAGESEEKESGSVFYHFISSGIRPTIRVCQSVECNRP